VVAVIGSLDSTSEGLAQLRRAQARAQTVEIRAGANVEIQLEL